MVTHLADYQSMLAKLLYNNITPTPTHTHTHTHTRDPQTVTRLTTTTGENPATSTGCVALRRKGNTQHQPTAVLTPHDANHNTMDHLPKERMKVKLSFGNVHKLTSLTWEIRDNVD